MVKSRNAPHGGEGVEGVIEAQESKRDTPARRGRSCRTIGPLKMIGGYPRTAGKEMGVHFFLDDYQGPPCTAGKEVVNAELAVYNEGTPPHGGEGDNPMFFKCRPQRDTPARRGRSFSDVSEIAPEGGHPRTAGKEG